MGISHSKVISGINSIKNNKKFTFFSNNLPKELYFQIFNYLNMNDLAVFRKVDRKDKNRVDEFLALRIPVKCKEKLNIYTYHDYIREIKKFSKERYPAKLAIDTDDSRLLDLLAIEKFNFSVLQIHERIVININATRNGEKHYIWCPPLYYAALMGKTNLIKLLLSHGCCIKQDVTLERNWLVNGNPKTSYENFTIEQIMVRIKNHDCKSLLWLAYAENALMNGNEGSEAESYIQQSMLENGEVASGYLESIKVSKRGFQKTYNDEEVELFESMLNHAVNATNANSAR